MENQNNDFKRAAAKKLIQTDALAKAEEITGSSYKNDELTGMLGLIISAQKNAITTKLLEELDDTTFSNRESDYLRKMQDFGFDIVLTIPFNNKEGIEERFYVLFHRRLGILLQFDTFTWSDDGSWAKAGKQVPPPSVNGGKFYYNWSPNSKTNRNGLTSSGGFMSKREDRFCTMFDNNLNEIDQNTLNIPAEVDFFSSTKEERDENRKLIDEALSKVSYRMVWVGDHDCREAVKTNILGLIDNGVFLPKWKKRPFLWLLHYMDTKTEGYDYEAITNERIAMLPEDVRKAITPDAE